VDLELCPARLLTTFLETRSERTQRAYRQDLETFRHFTQQPAVEGAVALLVGSTQGKANALALEYRAHLSRSQLSPATINRRLAALRSLVKRARALGMVSWVLDVPNIKTQPYRDTRGPGRDGFNRLLKIARRRKDSTGLRNLAALRLLFDLALRREEVVSLDVCDVDLERSSVAVLGKGRSQRTLLTLPPPTHAALSAWIAERGLEPGPLFVNFDPARKGRRLTGRSLYRIVRNLGTQAGLRVTPHGLRHAAITEALNLTRGDVRAVQRFSRHRDLRVLNLYDDSREDLGGRVARMVASGRRRGA
jgi:integrase/recombinase XerC